MLNLSLLNFQNLKFRCYSIAGGLLITVGGYLCTRIRIRVFVYTRFRVYAFSCTRFRIRVFVYAFSCTVLYTVPYSVLYAEATG